MPEYTILYIPSPARIRLEYSIVHGEKLPLISAKIICGTSFRAVAVLGSENLIDKSLVNLCGFKYEGKIVIGAIRKEVVVRVADL